MVANGTKPTVITIRLPAGTRPEGIARVSDDELFVACLSGALLHVDLRSNAVTQVYDEPMFALSGAKWDARQNALFVAATLSGKAFIYYLERAHRAPGSGGTEDDRGDDDYDSEAADEGDEEDEESDGWGRRSGARGKRAGGRGGPAPGVGLESILDFTTRRFATAPWQLKRRVAVQLAKFPPWYINDVALSEEAVLFTDSFAGRLWAIPRFHTGKGAPPVAYYDLGAAFQILPGQFKANGLAVLPSAALKGPATAAIAAVTAAAAAAAGNSSAAARGGAAIAAAAAARRISNKVGGGTGTPLLIANLHEGNLYRVVLPASKKKGKLSKGLFGSAGAADVSKVALPAVAGRRLLLDGLIVADDHTVYAADNYHNRVVQLRLGVDAGSAAVTCVIQPDEYHVPTTLAITGSGASAVLWSVNAHLDTCLPFVPCPRHAFEIIGVRPAEFCESV